MQTRALVILTTCALLFACSRKEPPPATNPESNPPAPPTVTAPQAVNPTNIANPAGAPTTSAAAFVGLNPAPTNTATSIPGVGGSLQLVTAINGVQISGNVTGLAPNSEHGFHIHETGDCASPDFTSAGGHFNPGGAKHGNPASPPHHVGDIPSIKADAKGVAIVHAAIMGATLNDAGPNDIIGKSLIVHARRDDYKTQPSGDSGDRIACGVIEPLP